MDDFSGRKVENHPKIDIDAVVKVFCVHTEPNFSLPWQRKQQYSSGSSGFVIGGQRVLASAHSFKYHTKAKLQKRGSDTKYPATVLAIGHECDIALLTVSNNEFWEGVTPVELGDLPALQDAVTVVGYPVGGDTVSVTSGVVSRLEFRSYFTSSTKLLALQIDAAVNPGNSGGPAFNNKGKCVGIAFQALKHKELVENIGYVIPTPVIEHFIQDYKKNGAYTGFPVIGFEWQKMENINLRLSMNMALEQTGVRIVSINRTAPANELKPCDVILKFDKRDIANDGTVLYSHGERTSFSDLVSQKYNGDIVPIKILRDSEILEFNITLESDKPLIPAHLKEKPPSYFIVGGLVFIAVSAPYLKSEYGKDSKFVPLNFSDKYGHAIVESDDAQIVVISQVLAADVNDGYQEITNKPVKAFNNQLVRKLEGLAVMVDSCDEKYLKFQLESNQIVVLDNLAAKRSTADILAMHGIPYATSDDLKLWRRSLR